VYYKTYVPFIKDEDFALDDVGLVPRINEALAQHGLTDSQELINRQLAVDCTHPQSITLTHHKNVNSRSPLQFKGDSSGDAVFNALHARHRSLDLPFVTTNHFDIDSFVSVFVALAAPCPSFSSEEEMANCFPLRHEALLRQISKIGDFRELTPTSAVSVEALKVCCWLNTVEKREFYRPFDGDESEGSPAKFDYFLPLFPAVLENVDDFESEWRAEYDLVLAGVKQLESAEVHRYPELGLITIATTEPVHYYALFSLTHGYDVVLAMYQGQRYELEYKYTSYVDVMSRPIRPRVDPARFLEKLNDLEEPALPDLVWNGSRIVDSGPITRLDRKGLRLNKVERYGHPYERPIYASSILPSKISGLLKSYLTHAYKGVEPKTPWNWQEIHKFNRSVDWDSWSEANN